MTSRLRPTSRYYQHAAFVVSLMVLVACDQPLPERPLEGAPPVAAGTPVRLQALAPPTLAPPSSFSLTPTELPFAAAASPSPELGASPNASPGPYPSFTSLLPAPGTTLPPGDVVIGARVTGSSDLVDITAYIDGEQVPIDLSGQPVRVKVVNVVRSLSSGQHEIRIEAHDSRGQLGGYRWQFNIGPGRALPDLPIRSPEPLPTLTPLPIPTRRPLPTPLPTITPRPAPTITSRFAPPPLVPPPTTEVQR